MTQSISIRPTITRHAFIIRHRNMSGALRIEQVANGSAQARYAILVVESDGRSGRELLDEYEPLPLREALSEASSLLRSAYADAMEEADARMGDRCP